MTLSKLHAFTCPKKTIPASPGNRKRIRVERTRDWELILMVWGTKASTPIHDHNHSKCRMRLLEGNLVEEFYTGEVPMFITEIYESKSERRRILFLIFGVREFCHETLLECLKFRGLWALNFWLHCFHTLR